MADTLLATTRSAELFARAQNLLPGGVDSPVRAFRAVEVNRVQAVSGAANWPVKSQRPPSLNESSDST